MSEQTRIAAAECVARIYAGNSPTPNQFKEILAVIEKLDRFLRTGVVS